MFENLKYTINTLARQAVMYAELKLGSECGQQKKQLAVNFVVDRMPVAKPFKLLLAKLFSSFIDDAVEFAVIMLKTRTESEIQKY